MKRIRISESALRKMITEGVLSALRDDPYEDYSEEEITHGLDPWELLNIDPDMQKEEQREEGFRNFERETADNDIEPDRVAESVIRKLRRLK